MSKTAIILGDRSDIAKALIPFLEADGWTVHGWNRDSEGVRAVEWDLVICALGQVAPVGYWYDQKSDEVAECFRSNVLRPLQLVRNMWTLRKPGASVCFLAGSNPNSIMPGYAAYNASKMSLLKLVEQMDHESDAKIFALGPGYVKTRIHKPTLDANWPNERIARGDDGTPIERIYGCLKWCLEAPKSAVGGRNICASDALGSALASLLEENPSMFKLRRQE